MKNKLVLIYLLDHKQHKLTCYGEEADLVDMAEYYNDFAMVSYCNFSSTEENASV